MSDQQNSDEDELDEILAEYLTTEEEGRAPDLQSLIDAYPHHRQAIQDFLMDHLTLSNLAPPQQPTPIHNPYVFEPGTVFDGYRILEQAGIGGSAVVYRAIQENPKRDVALKVLTPSLHRRVEMVGRFRAEAAILARLNHSGVAPIYSFGESDGFLYLTTEWLPGGSLQDRITDFQSQPRMAAEIIGKIAEAVAHAHARGVIHRDLKPSNIMFDLMGNPKLVDFGFAFEEDRQTQLTRTGDTAGTPEYMAPEQANRTIGPISVSTDVHGLGACLYACLTGEPPFTGESLMDVLSAVVRENPVSAERVNSRVPTDLAVVCQHCLEKDPASRYRTAIELSDDLSRFLQGMPTRARPTRFTRKVTMWAKRRPTAAIAFSTITIMSFVMAVVSLIAVRSEWRAQASGEVAANNQFFMNLERIRTTRNDAGAGWTAKNLSVLRELAHHPLSQKYLPELRSEAAAALGSPDLIAHTDIAVGFDGYAVATHPTEAAIAIASWGRETDQTLKIAIFDTQTDSMIRTLEWVRDTNWEKQPDGGLDGFRSAAISPDGRWLAAGTRSGQVILWEWAAPHRWTVSTRRHRQAVEQLSFSRSSQFLLSRSPEELACQHQTLGWAETGYLKSAIKELPATIKEDSFLAVIDNPGEGYLARLDTRTLLRTDSWEASRKWSGIFTPNQRSSIGLHPHRIDLGDIDTGAFIKRTAIFDVDDFGPNNRIAFTSDEQTFVVASEFSNRVGLWELTSLASVISPAITRGGSHIVGTIHKGQRIFVAGDSRVHVYDLSGRDVQTMTEWGTKQIHSFDVSESGHRLAITRDPYESDQQRVIELFEQPNGTPSPLRIPAGSPGDAVMGCTTANGFCYLTGGHKDHYLSYLSREANRSQLFGSWHVKNLNLLVTDKNDLWIETENEMLHYTLPRDKPDGNWLRGDTLFGKDFTVQSLHAQASGLLIGTRDGFVHRLIRGEKRPTRWQAFDVPVTAVAHYYDVAVAVAGSQTGDIGLFSLLDSRPPRILRSAHSEVINTIATSPSGIFATGSSDRTVKLWTRNGELILTLRFRANIRRIQFSRNGKDLYVLVSGERAVRIWHLDQLSERMHNLGLDSGLFPQN